MEQVQEPGPPDKVAISSTAVDIISSVNNSLYVPRCLPSQLVTVPVLPANTEPTSLQQTHQANPGTQASDHPAACSPCFEFVPQAAKCLPDRPVVVEGQFAGSWNVVDEVNTLGTIEYSPVLHKTASQQSLLLKTAEHSFEHSILSPEPVDCAQEFLPLEAVSQQSHCLNTGECLKECSQFPPELTCQAQELFLSVSPMLLKAKPVVLFFNFFYS